MSELEKILAIPATQPAIKAFAMCQAYRAGMLDPSDIDRLRADWDWAVVAYQIDGKQKTYHPSFPLDSFVPQTGPRPSLQPQ